MRITQEIADILNRVDRPGDFFTSGHADFLAPSIEVEGVGRIALPLLPAQMKHLIEIATRAPYGRGPETLVDTDVRRTWQIEADLITITGKHWPKTLANIVKRAADGLGVDGTVSAELYKMLVYDKGSFFLSHRDTEKTPGMFATMVISLPSASEGGELVVRHKEREAKLDLSNKDPVEIAFAAFYADCIHEVLPVTAGCRLTLVFNLMRTGKDEALTPPAYETEAKHVAVLLKNWADTQPMPSGEPLETGAEHDNKPKKIVYPLQHAYTPAELSFDALKGTDAAVAKVLAAAAPDAGCDLYLALLKIWESGTAEYNGNYRRRYGRSWYSEEDEDDGDEFEEGEVLDGDASLGEWRCLDDSQFLLGALPVEDDEYAPPDAFEDMKPDEQHFHEATGNAGASFERTYVRAALVVWPSSRFLAVINQAGLSGTLPYLEDLLNQWQAAAPEKGRTAKQQAVALAGLMIASWPSGGWFDTARLEPTETGRMLHLLTRLKEPDLIEQLLHQLTAQEEHATADNESLLSAIALLPDDVAARWLASLIAAHGIAAFDACAALLQDALNGCFSNQPSLLHPATQTLVAALPGDPDHTSKDKWGRSKLARPSITGIVNAVTIVDRIHSDLAINAAEHILAWPKHFGVDAMVVPAVKRLVQSENHNGAALNDLRLACIAHLENRIAEPLEAPKDWTRPSQVGCDCQYCSELSLFLANPNEECWTLRVRQQIRDHVEDTIRHAKADLDRETLKRGSPHSLICTKNDASYQRRVAQRKQDLTDLTILQQ